MKSKPAGGALGVWGAGGPAVPWLPRQQIIRNLRSNTTGFDADQSRATTSDFNGFTNTPREMHGRNNRNGTGATMYKHILIPTDGSTLSQNAIRHGVTLAKALSAKVTGINVSTPFSVLAVEPAMVSDTPESYKQRVESMAARSLGDVRDAATKAAIGCELVHVEHEHPY
jgi:hypothetical protein